MTVKDEGLLPALRKLVEGATRGDLGAQKAASVTLLGDGAAWIWGRAEELRQALDIPREQFTEIVDYYHAVEHLTEIADFAKPWNGTKRIMWLAKAKDHLSNGSIEALVAHIDELATDRQSPDIESAIDYFVKNEARMRYKRFKQAGLPIGSGAVESGVRRFLNQRLKGNSIYWLEDHAEAVLHLRAQLRARTMRRASCSFRPNARWMSGTMRVIRRRLKKTFATCTSHAPFEVYATRCNGLES